MIVHSFCLAIHVYNEILTYKLKNWECYIFVFKLRNKLHPCLNPNCLKCNDVKVKVNQENVIYGLILKIIKLRIFLYSENTLKIS